MAITEKTRHELYQRLEKILGPDEATTLMEHLPPVGWADVATKDDLRHLEERLDLRFESLESKLHTEIVTLGSDLRTDMANLAIEVHSTLRTNVFLMIGAMAALVGLVGAVTSLG